MSGFGNLVFDRGAVCEIMPQLRMLSLDGGNGFATFCINEKIALLAKDSSTLAAFAAASPNGFKPLMVSAGDDYAEKFAQYKKENGSEPKVAVILGQGIVAFGKTKKAADIVKAIVFDIAKLTDAPDDKALTDAISKNIDALSADSETQKRLTGKIAIVTGSAQGFGKGIAEAMCEEGACVVIADLNIDGAQACADELASKNARPCTIAVQSNVADEASVQAMVEDCVLSFGGLDILVANAGIAIAGDLTEMTRDKFDLVTAVNYTGYFLCTKYATAPMKLQHKVKPDYAMDVIEINSKSGLQGSNKNFAYAGSKFGGVGLTQSFAMELVTYNIKCNAICPGNLLDGPLWSDPVKGLFKQYLDAGKVPGAKDVADVRRFYESKVPMNRGCQTIDVARAIFYCVEQQYETGQAIPVTGGQVMLK